MKIEPILKTQCFGQKIYYYDEVESTNQLAKEKAAQGAPEGTLLIAEGQTAGRGRLGRVWDSPYGSGIWMSIILRPPMLPQEISGITLLAGLAVCKAIREITKLDAFIKWPNDIVVNGKKVSGILTEMRGDMDKVNYLVVGIGLNVNTIKIADHLQQIATSLAIESGESYAREHIVAQVLLLFEKYYKEYLKQSSLSFMLDEYRALCISLTNKIKVTEKKESYIATPVGIDSTGALIIDKEDGKRQTIQSGEVSVRGLYGYV